MFDYDVIVIGCGPAGLMAVAELKEKGINVLGVDKKPMLDRNVRSASGFFIDGQEMNGEYIQCEPLKGKTRITYTKCGFSLEYSSPMEGIHHTHIISNTGSHFQATSRKKPLYHLFNPSTWLSDRYKIAKELGVPFMTSTLAIRTKEITGGVEVTLRTNGKTKKPSSVMEGIRQLDELNMAPGHLQKEVTKILHSAHPRIGLEFEVCFSSSDDESNPDIQSYTSMQDVQDFFTYNEGSDFDDIGNLYQEWLDDKQGEWTNERVEATLNNPSDETYEKKDFMANHYTTSGDADEYLEAMDADEITEELADEVISRADQIYKANGPADEWPQPPEGSDPFILLYYEIFVEDNEEASDYFNEFYMQDFYDSVLASGDDDYSVGTWLKSIHINSMGDVSREFPDTLTWTGGAMYDGEFNLAFAEEVANELTYDLGIEAEVMPEYETGDGPVQYNNWWVTHDPSVNAKEGDTALEIITATMDYEDGIRDIEEFMGYLKDKNAYTNESTGLHINVSMANIDHSNVDYAKLIVMLGDSHILSKFGREFNEYAEHSLIKLGELMDASQGYERDKPGRAKSYATLMSKMKSNLNNVVAEAFKDMPIDKYSSVGLKDDRIEFRSAGGSDYLNNFDQILSLINRFIVAYAVAADPEAHKKEYGKKLYKLASNVGQGQASKSSMTLFAGFGAGIITKEDLIKQLKAKREMARVEPIDTGEFVPKQFDELNADEDIDGQAAEQIAKKWNKSYEAVKRLWNKSLAIEMNSMPPPREPDRNVYNNLMKDIRHYQADELPGLELVVNKYQVSYEKASGLLRHAIGVEMINATDSADANRTALQNILADIGHYE